jgi:hypothetical protein
MFGRAALLLVMGMSALFLVYTSNMISTANKTVDFYTQYYQYTVAENMGISAANIACNAIYTSVVNKTTVWTAGFDIPFFFDQTFTSSKNRVVATVTQRGTDTLILLCTAYYGDSVRCLKIRLHASQYSKYGAFYNKSTGATFATGDTLDGPTHFNDYLYTTGSPVFLGKVSTLYGLKASGSPAAPKFLGGFESGINISLTIDVSSIATDASGGYTFSGTASNPYIAVDLTLNSNGTVTYKTKTANSSSKLTSASYGTATTVALSTLAPNGVVLIKGGNVTMRGTLKGQATVAALANGLGSGFGNVYIDDDVVYNTDPRIDATSTDMLGIVAENSTTLTYNNSRGDVTIMGSIMSQNTGLVVDSYDSYSKAYNMNIYGGVIAPNVNATATYNSSGIAIRGYRYSQKYDNRFLNYSPPKFPLTNTYEVLSWVSYCPVCNY